MSKLKKKSNDRALKYTCKNTLIILNIPKKIPLDFVLFLVFVTLIYLEVALAEQSICQTFMLKSYQYVFRQVHLLAVSILSSSLLPSQTVIPYS